MATVEEAKQVYRDYSKLWEVPPGVAVWQDGEFSRTIEWEDLDSLILEGNEFIAWDPFIGHLEGLWGSEGVPPQKMVMNLLVLDGRDLKEGVPLQHPLPGQSPIT